MVLVTSAQGGSCSHLQMFGSVLNFSFSAQNWSIQMHSQVDALKTLGLATIVLFSHFSCSPGGQVQKQDSSNSSAQGCIGAGQSQVQLSLSSCLGGSQV